MADLKIDMAELRSNVTRVNKSRNVLASMARAAESVAQDVGHRSLAGEVENFASKWSIAKDRLQEQLTFISDALTAIEQTLRDLDEDMARNVREGIAAGKEGDN